MTDPSPAARALEELRDLFAYDRWADARTLNACEALAPEDRARDLGSSFGSILGTLWHVASANWIWLERWRGHSPDGPPADWDRGSWDQLRVVVTRLEGELAGWLDRLQPPDLDRILEYRNVRGDRFAEPLWQPMRHRVNHSSYHRGQVVTMLRQLGASAPGTDLITYFRETGGVRFPT